MPDDRSGHVLAAQRLQMAEILLEECAKHAGGVHAFSDEHSSDLRSLDQTYPAVWESLIAARNELAKLGLPVAPFDECCRQGNLYQGYAETPVLSSKAAEVAALVGSAVINCGVDSGAAVICNPQLVRANAAGLQLAARAMRELKALLPAGMLPEEPARSFQVRKRVPVLAIAGGIILALAVLASLLLLYI